MSSNFTVPPSAKATKPATQIPTDIPEETKESSLKYKDEAQLNEFWNCVVRKKPYMKEVELRGLKITLRTKSTKEVEELMKYMDKNNTTLVSTYDYVYSKALLALSLVKYGEDFLDNGTFEEKLGYVDSLADVVMRVLIKAAANFEKEIEQMEAAIYNPNF